MSDAMNTACEKCGKMQFWIGLNGKDYKYRCLPCDYAELEALRAKLVTADQLAKQAAKTISYSNYMEPALYVGLERALREYRGETKMSGWPPSNLDSVLKQLDEASALHMKKEIEALRAKIEKAEAVIEATVHLIDDYGYTLGKGTEEVLLALKEYGEPNTQKPQTHSV